MIRNKLNNINQKFTADFIQIRSVKTFRISIYIYLLFSVFMLLSEYDVVWGNTPYLSPQDYKNTGGSAILNLLSNWPQVAPYLITLHILFLMLGVFNKIPTISAFMIWFTTYNLYNPNHIWLTGGEVLMHQLLFFMIFIRENKKDIWSNTINHTFFWACRIQILFVYLFAGIFKLYDNNWINGSALEHILQIEAFSRSPFSEWLLACPFLLKLGTWSALVYQLLFPIVIWFKKIKPYFLVAGVVFHLVIAFVAGVFSFGIIMILSYLIWLDFEKGKKYHFIVSRINLFKNKLFVSSKTKK